MITPKIRLKYISVFLLPVISMLLINLCACNKMVETEEPFVAPPHFPEPVYAFDKNPPDQQVFELGRKLFYDPLLSGNNTISCGSCHLQSSAFSHGGHDVSHGIHDRLGTRNSPTLFNLAWNTHFFWDGGVFDLDLQPIVPITNPVEMEDDMDNVMKKLQEHPDYPKLFKRAFGSDEIASAQMLKALSQFMLALVSSQSRYDSMLRSEIIYTEKERQGYKIFQERCADCHQEPLMTDQRFRDNGLPARPDSDPGRYLITLREEDRFRFRVPSLRNLSYSDPYMHDGRFYSVGQVLNHYSNMKERPGIDPLLKRNGVTGIPLDEQEKEKLLSFLKTLDDPAFIRNPKFSEP